MIQITLEFRKIPSTGAFSGIAGCTPSIASQWNVRDVSRGAFGKGASITCTGKENLETSHQNEIQLSL